jgi:Ca2+-transporting ATPase
MDPSTNGFCTNNFINLCDSFFLSVDTMGALALGTEPPAAELLLRRPYKRDASLINLPMWRNILAQSSYQLGLLIYLLREGPEVFGCESGSTHHFTIIFNAFVFCQVFNEFNAREIGDVFNPFKNLAHSPMFLAVIFFTIVAQWIIVDYGGDFTQTSPLSLYEWKITCMLGAVSIPVGYIMRQIPVNEDPDSFAGLVDSKTHKEAKSSSPLTLFVLPVAVAVGYKFLLD